VDDWSKVNFQFSPMNLMAAKWNFISTVSKEFTPLLSASLSLVYSPGMNLFILLPSLKYDIATNLDIDITWQSFFTELENKFQAAAQRISEGEMELLNIRKKTSYIRWISFFILTDENWIFR